MSTITGRNLTFNDTVKLWSSIDASELYDVARWGKGYFSVGDNGNLFVHPTKEPGRSFRSTSSN
jgi:arginine decarboxylase